MTVKELHDILSVYVKDAPDMQVVVFDELIRSELGYRAEGINARPELLIPGDVEANEPELKSNPVRSGGVTCLAIG